MKNIIKAAGLMAVSPLALSILPISPASAQNLEEMQSQLQALQEQIQSLQSQIEDVKKAEADKADDLKISWKGAPEISSADGKYSMKIRGRILADAAFGSQDEAVTGMDDLSATEFRAARIGVQGSILGNKYVIETDFAGDSVSLADAYVGFGVGAVDLKVGQFKTSNSIEELTSARYIEFMERGAITDAFGLSRQIGVQAEIEGDIWTLTGGVFKGSAGSGNTDEGLTLVARATAGPKVGDTQLHIGGHVRHREVGDDQGLLRYRQRPHQHLAGRFVDTGAFADSDFLWGLEAAAVQGPFSVSGEYMSLKADAVDPLVADATFDGYNVSASWFVTGESRKYGGGTFGRVSVKEPVNEGGFGAWQLALRFDTIDLTDGAVMGGSQDSYIAAVNWHLTNYVRLMANYNKSKVDGGIYDGADIDLVGFRAQVDW